MNYQQQLQQIEAQRRQLEEARRQISAYQTRIPRSRAELARATPQIQVGVRQQELERRRAQQKTLGELKKFQEQFETKLSPYETKLRSLQAQLSPEYQAELKRLAQRRRTKLLQKWVTLGRKSTERKLAEQGLKPIYSFGKLTGVEDVAAGISIALEDLNIPSSQLGDLRYDIAKTPLGQELGVPSFEQTPFGLSFEKSFAPKVVPQGYKPTPQALPYQYRGTVSDIKTAPYQPDIKPYNLSVWQAVQKVGAVGENVFGYPSKKWSEFQKQRLEAEAQQGKVEMFGGETDLLPYQKKGTAVVTGVTPYTEEELLSLPFGAGENVFLERQESLTQFKIEEEAEKIAQDLLPTYQELAQKQADEIQNSISRGDLTYEQGQEKLQDYVSNLETKFSQEVSTKVQPYSEQLSKETGEILTQAAKKRIISDTLATAPIMAATGFGLGLLGAVSKPVAAVSGILGGAIAVKEAPAIFEMARAGEYEGLVGAGISLGAFAGGGYAGARVGGNLKSSSEVSDAIQRARIQTTSSAANFDALVKQLKLSDAAKLEIKTLVDRGYTLRLLKAGLVAATSSDAKLLPNVQGRLIEVVGRDGRVVERVAIGRFFAQSQKGKTFSRDVLNRAVGKLEGNKALYYNRIIEGKIKGERFKPIYETKVLEEVELKGAVGTYDPVTGLPVKELYGEGRIDLVGAEKVKTGKVWQYEPYVKEMSAVDLLFGKVKRGIPLLPIFKKVLGKKPSLEKVELFLKEVKTEELLGKTYLTARDVSLFGVDILAAGKKGITRAGGLLSETEGAALFDPFLPLKPSRAMKKWDVKKQADVFPKREIKPFEAKEETGTILDTSKSIYEGKGLYEFETGVFSPLLKTFTGKAITKFDVTRPPLLVDIPKVEVSIKQPQINLFDVRENIFVGDLEKVRGEFKLTSELRQEELQKIKTEDVFKFAQVPITKFAQPTKFALKPVQITSQRLRQQERLRQEERLRQIQRFGFKTPTPPLKQKPSSLIPPIITLSKQRRPYFPKGKSKKLDELFIAQIRRRGKWIDILKTPKYERALFGGVKAVRGGLGASLRIRKGGELIKIAPPSNMFRYAKREPFTIVQRRGARLSSAGERKEIGLSRKRKIKFI